ncbi:N-acetyltransferase [Sedimentibacter hydroxybenzoicus DSM 7310]|uniref:N-acetyltransferase n=1 Tax=Sedimentibacter hydroxybenzoicus DSM 7310 TaxID=1123245 RepID=A0A974GV75_SEDHY|nr:peptidogalycan biosysnthesis protein [Sedimentibacter hydroxybenzoicus]NYB72805.1 N-acetyltransferase [Sedimentibacter hydroxybenzoicus DSM 7310]
MHFKVFNKIEEIGEENWNGLNLDYVCIDGLYHYSIISEQINSILLPKYIEIEDGLDKSMVLFYQLEVEDIYAEGNEWLEGFIKLYFPESIYKIMEKNDKELQSLFLVVLPDLDEEKTYKYSHEIEKRLHEIFNLKDEISLLAFTTSYKLEQYISDLQISYMYYDINDDYETFDDFLKSLTCNQRRIIKLDRKKMEKFGVSVKEINSQEYLNDMKEINKLNKFPIQEDLLDSVVKAENGFLTLGFFKEGKLIQYLTIVYGNNLGHGAIIASIENINREWNGVLNSYTSCIDIVIKKKIKRYYLGYTCQEAKSLRGAKIINRFVNAKLYNPRWREKDDQISNQRDY